MSAPRLLRLVRLLEGAVVDVWVDGGWGVDALAGRQTREHGDLDLGVARSDLDLAIEVLGAQGYLVSDDRYRQVTVRLTDPGGNRIDLHPSTHLPDGGSEQVDFDGDTFYIAPPVSGRIHGERVRCMPIEAHVRTHVGYELRPEDHHDLAILADLSREGDLPA